MIIRPPRPPSAPSSGPGIQQQRPAAAPSNSFEGPRANSDIRAREVRLVGADGEMVGVLSLRDALIAADEAGLDLVEVSPNATPPVCKLLDYGKYKYELQKKAAEARKKQKVIDIKEIKLRPNIDEHDLEIKLRNARAFLEEGDKVKITLRFRGRESSRPEFAYQLIDRVKSSLADVAKVEQDAKMDGRQMLMLLGPSKA